MKEIIAEEHWQAFLNHLLPKPSSSQRTEMRTEKNGTITRVPTVDPPPTVPAKDHLQKVVGEWNEGFFIPRDVSVILHTTLVETNVVTSAKKKCSGPPFVEAIRNHVAASKLGPAVYEAVKNADVSTLVTLLGQGADPSYRPCGGHPPLVLAIKKPPFMLQPLLTWGANLNDHAPGDGTALWYAIKAGREDDVKTLLRYGASIDNAHESGGEPAIYRVVQKGDEHLLRLLLSHRPYNIDKSPPGGASALYKAAKEGHASMVRELLIHGANPNCKEPGSSTALHKAVKRGDYEIAKLLLENGANSDGPDPGGKSTLSEAVKKSDKDMVRLLLAHGADIHKRSCGNKDAITYASAKGDTAMVNILLQEGSAS